jgi:2-methylisocitrate lyase-like PEP mutase family enzyme
MLRMTNETQRALAAALRAQHRDGPIIVLPNAHDVVSARIAAAGRPVALGTTSAGMAWAAGYPDGERIPREEMLAAVERVVRAVDVGVTADLEAGYGDTPEAAADTAAAALEIGVVGLNLQDTGQAGGAYADGLVPIELMAEKIAAVRDVAEREGIELAINARTDVFLFGHGGDDDSRIEEAARRGRAYLDAGADCAFVPGAVAADTIARLVAAIDGPINVYALPGVPPVSELNRLGVRRVSVGCGPYQACLRLLEEATAELLERGTYDTFTAAHLPYPDVQQLLVVGAGRAAEQTHV